MTKTLMCPQDLLNQDLTNKLYIVTGGSSGIGRETVMQLARQGANVVLACRRTPEGDRVKQEAGPVKGKIEVAPLDLADLSSVRAFAKAFLERHSQLQGLVNNAGVMNTPQGRTRDGFETQFGTNHLGHYLLTELLLPALKKGSPSRVVCVSSCYHEYAVGRKGHIAFEDLNFETRKYDGWEAYAQSKLANVLHARYLAKQLEGTGVSAFSLHPGWVRTNLVKYSLPVWMQDVLLKPFFRLAGMVEPWEGAQTTLYTLLSPDIESKSGQFFSQVGVYRDRAARAGGWPLHSPSAEANDDAVAQRLDEVSRRLVGL